MRSEQPFSTALVDVMQAIADGLRERVKNPQAVLVQYFTKLWKPREVPLKRGDQQAIRLSGDLGDHLVRKSVSREYRLNAGHTFAPRRNRFYGCAVFHDS